MWSQDLRLSFISKKTDENQLLQMQMRASLCQSRKMSYCQSGHSPQPRTKQRRKNFNCDYKGWGYMLCKIQQVNGLDQVRSEPQQRSGRGLFQRGSSAHQIQLRDKVNVSCQEPLVGSQSQECQGTKGESVKSKGMGGTSHTPAPCTEPLFFSYTFHLPPHPSFRGKPIKTWKILKFRRTNIREENRSKLPFYDGIAKEKPWRTEISIRVLSYLLWSIQQNTHPTSPNPSPPPQHSDINYLTKSIRPLLLLWE